MYCDMITIVALANISIMSCNYHIFSVLTTIKIQSLSSLEISNTVLWTIITVLCIRSKNLFIDQLLSLLTVVNKAAMNILTKTFFWTYVFISLGLEFHKRRICQYLTLSDIDKPLSRKCLEAKSSSPWNHHPVLPTVQYFRTTLLYLYPVFSMFTPGGPGSTNFFFMPASKCL